MLRGMVDLNVYAMLIASGQRNSLETVSVCLDRKDRTQICKLFRKCFSGIQEI
jgi:hypothetical protein